MMAGQNCWILKDCIMQVKIHELAAKEFGDAIEWYGSFSGVNPGSHLPRRLFFYFHILQVSYDPSA